MRRSLVVGLVALVLPFVAHAQSAQQALVDRATLAVQDLMSPPDGTQATNMLRRARAVMVCPEVFKAGFLFGGEGGDCVLTARDANGSWSDPAFYKMWTGSIGFQLGIQDSELILCILTEKGLAAIMDHQFKIGATADVAFATLGGGVGGATTAALRADIVAFSKDRGLWAGVAFNGSSLSTDTASNQSYYGNAFAARQIVMQMQANNPGADPLRMMLSRYGGGQQATPYAQAAPVQAAPTQAAPPPPAAPGPIPLQPRAPVQQQSLPPPTQH